MRKDPLQDLTDRLRQAGDPAVRKQIWDDVYSQLKKIANKQSSFDQGYSGESPTDLLHAIFEGVDRAMVNPDVDFENRAKFFGYVKVAMRHHRVAQAQNRTNLIVIAELQNEDCIEWTAEPWIAVAVNRALEIVAQEDPRGAEAFELRYYFGFSHAEILEEMKDQYKKKSLIASDLTNVRKRLIRILTEK